MRLLMCVILSLFLCWGCGDPPPSVMEMVLPDKDMPAVEEPTLPAEPTVTEEQPAVTMADVKTTPVVIETEKPPVEVPPGTLEEEQPPPVVTELPDLSLVAEMEAILASEGEVISPIPDHVYELLWGHWTKAGSAEPRRFYTRYINADGIAIVGSDNVEDLFFQVARHVVLVMTSKVPGLREALSVDQVGGIGGDEPPFRFVLTNREERDVVNMPEHLNTNLGQTTAWVGSFAGYYARADVYFWGENNELFTGHQIIIHEMAHAIDKAITVRNLVPNFRNRVDTAFDKEMEKVQLRTEVDGEPYIWNREQLDALPEWEDRPSYCIVQGNAHDNTAEFWAIFVQDRWFDGTFNPGRLGDPNYVPLPYAREECPNLVEVLEEVFPPFDLHYAVESRGYTRADGRVLRRN